MIQHPISTDDLEDEMPEALLERLAIEASEDSVQQLLARGISVFYFEDDILIREDTDGRRYEVRHTQPKRGTYDVIRELERAR